MRDATLLEIKISVMVMSKLIEYMDKHNIVTPYIAIERMIDTISESGEIK